MAFSSSQRGQFSERNVAFGERGAKKRRDELAGYAELLQELKNQGGLDFLASKQEFERPEQEARIDRFGAETEGFQLGNEGQRFYQGLAKEFGRSAIMRELGLGEPESEFESRANFSRPQLQPFSNRYTQAREGTLPGLRAKSNVSAIRSSGNTAPAVPGGGSGFQIGPVPWALNLRKRRKEDEEAARIRR